MKAVVLAAGKAIRMGYKPKAIEKVAGVEIIGRTVKLLSPYVEEFIFVIYRKEVEEYVRNLGVKFRIVKNDMPEKGNGYSLYLARELVDERFIVVMGDHVYSEEFINKAVKLEGAICDRKPRFIDISEATKVKLKDGKIIKAGKEIEDYDCVDTGFFILEKNIFNLFDFFVKDKEIKLSDVISRAGVKASFVDGEFWMDIDTPEDLKRANKLLIKVSVKGYEDGMISRLINRKISTKISEILVNRITPMSMTIFSFIIGILSSAVAVINLGIGGIIYQISSILDGVDGEIARASLKTSKIGGYVDSILDRIVDFTFLTTVSIISNVFIPAIFAIFGTVMVSYTTEKYKAEFKESIYRIAKFRHILRYIPGKRDERIFLIMLFCLIGYVEVMFWLISFISFFRFFTTLFLVIRHRAESY